MRGCAIILISAVLLGCNDNASQAKDLAQNEVISNLTHIHNISFDEVKTYPHKNNEWIVCGKYVDDTMVKHRFISSIYSHTAGLEATPPFIEGKGTGKGVMDSLWQSECR